MGRTHFTAYGLTEHVSSHIALDGVSLAWTLACKDGNEYW